MFSWKWVQDSGSSISKPNCHRTPPLLHPSPSTTHVLWHQLACLILYELLLPSQRISWASNSLSEGKIGMLSCLHGYSLHQGTYRLHLRSIRALSLFQDPYSAIFLWVTSDLQLACLVLGGKQVCPLNCKSNKVFRSYLKIAQTPSRFAHSFGGWRLQWLYVTLYQRVIHRSWSALKEVKSRAVESAPASMCLFSSLVLLLSRRAVFLSLFRRHERT